jgi:hypothetical protein
MSSHRPGIDVPNVNHKINADGDHEFKGGNQHKIIKQGDTAGLQSHLKHIHDNILGRGNMFVAHSGGKDQKVFNGGKPGVDALHKAVTAHINEGYDIESMLDYIEELESALDEAYHTIPVYHKDKSGKDTVAYWNGKAKSKSDARTLAKSHIGKLGGSDITFGK